MPLPLPSAIPALDWTRWSTRHLFFTGKGGVGKTTTASAVAVALAEAGERVLLVSTDPASNLPDVFAVDAGRDPVAVPGVDGLSLANVDPDQAAASYRERTLAPYRGVLPDSAIQSMEEQLSGACTVEIAAFNEFTAVLAGDAADGFDRVIFDTAPTGHTLRLLTLPGAWTGYTEEHPAGASCLGPLAGLERQRQQYAAAVATLSDPEQTEIVVVTRAEPGALTEAARASHELAALGITGQRLIVNGLLADPGNDPAAVAYAARQSAALAGAPKALDALPVSGVPLQAGDLIGVPALRALTARAAAVPRPTVGGANVLPDLGALIDELDQAGRGIVMTMGKGGVGKTTIAAAIALALADRGHDVTLSTTDPAAHVAHTLAETVHERLMIERIDPSAETDRYTQEILEAAEHLDPEGRQLLAEDLRSPCTEEVAVFRAFARTVDLATDRIVVLDTAPTGHTLLLLDAADSYQREIARTNATVPDSVRELGQRLRDPTFARILLTTLPESTPVAEARRLAHDLQRAGITPFGWVINQTLTATGTQHPVLRARAAAEQTHIASVQTLAGARTWGIAWQPEPPVGGAALRQLVDGAPVAATV